MSDLVLKLDKSLFTNSDVPIWSDINRKLMNKLIRCNQVYYDKYHKEPKYILLNKYVYHHLYAKDEINDTQLIQMENNYDDNMMIILTDNINFNETDMKNYNRKLKLESLCT